MIRPTLSNDCTTAFGTAWAIVSAALRPHLVWACIDLFFQHLLLRPFGRGLTARAWVQRATRCTRSYLDAAERGGVAEWLAGGGFAAFQAGSENGDVRASRSQHQGFHIPRGLNCIDNVSILERCSIFMHRHMFSLEKRSLVKPSNLERFNRISRSCSDTLSPWWWELAQPDPPGRGCRWQKSSPLYLHCLLVPSCVYSW